MTGHQTLLGTLNGATVFVFKTFMDDTGFHNPGSLILGFKRQRTWMRRTSEVVDAAVWQFAVDQGVHLLL